MVDPPQLVWVADSRLLQVTKVTCSVRIALHMNFGSVTLDPFALAVMPGTDNTLTLGYPTLEVLDFDIYAGFTECARWRVERRTKPMESMNYIACRHASLWLEVVQPQPLGNQYLDQAVEGVAQRDPEMVIKCVIRKMKRRVALEQTVGTTARNRLDQTQVAG